METVGVEPTSKDTVTQATTRVVCLFADSRKHYADKQASCALTWKSLAASSSGTSNRIPLKLSPATLHGR